MLLSKMKISATCYSKKQTNNKNNNKNKHTAEFPEDKIIFASSWSLRFQPNSFEVFHNPGEITKPGRAAEAPWLSYQKMLINKSTCCLWSSFSAGVCKGLSATQDNGTFTVLRKYWVIIVIVERFYSLLCRILALDFHMVWKLLFSCSVMSDCLQAHGLQLVRLLCPSTEIHRVDDAIQPSHLLPPAFPPAFSLSQHQGLSQWISSSNQVAKVF